MINFTIFGNMRFISHRETMRLFQRACNRAQINVVHSKGFNPRPKLSLPLPRSVSVESQDELLILKVRLTNDNFDCDELLKQLKLQMPEGIEPLKAEALNEKRKFNKGIVTYQFNVADNYKDRITDLMDHDTIIIKRKASPKKKVKNIDIRGYLRSIEQKENKILVECNFDMTGTIRADEITELLRIGQDDLTEPVKRMKINFN